jgi:hypothetical protein
MHPPSDRFATGLLAAWAMVVLVSFAVGITYAISIGGGLHSPKYHDAGTGIFLIVITFTCVSAVFGAIATFALGIPVLKAFITRGYTSGAAFFAAGIFISVAIATVLYASHHFGEFLVGSDFDFALLAGMISGPLAGLSFWSVHRRR